MTGPVRIGGWLVVVGLGLVLALYRQGSSFFSDQLPLFFRGNAEASTWEKVTTPSSPTYSRAWTRTILLEVGSSVVLMMASVALLFMFINRSRFFPRSYVMVACASIVLAAIDGWFNCSLIVDRELVMLTILNLGVRVAPTCIWIPYMVLSKRVRDTFVA